MIRSRASAATWRAARCRRPRSSRRRRRVAAASCSTTAAGSRSADRRGAGSTTLQPRSASTSACLGRDPEHLSRPCASARQRCPRLVLRRRHAPQHADQAGARARCRSRHRRRPQLAFRARESRQAGTASAYDGVNQLLQAVLVDPLVHDVHTLTTVNEIVAKAEPGEGEAGPARRPPSSGRRSYKRVPYMLIAPQTRNAIGECAVDAYKEHYSSLGGAARSRDLALLGHALDAGLNSVRGELFSYLFFAPSSRMCSTWAATTRSAGSAPARERPLAPAADAGLVRAQRRTIRMPARTAEPRLPPRRARMRRGGSRRGFGACR